ncbi:pyrrolo-quinoline quinone, partial [Eubacteriales bacterium OttesenSCG-928-N14]|nr:pyrrolo-quinoline quinone [Eubacteriales bacterium OttesenSCG-928-N14]
MANRRRDDYSDLNRRPAKRRRSHYRVANPGKLVLGGVLVVAIVALAIWGVTALFGSEGSNPVATNPITTLEPTPTPLADFITPAPVADTQPSKFGFSAKMQMDGQDVDVSSFTRDEPISFGTPETYTNLEGIVTFRSNNFRNTGSYGTVNMTEKKFDTNFWQVRTGSLPKSSSGAWTGSGWVGQPLLVKWPAETKELMTNMKEEYRNDPDFVEVIYATMDGKVYFLDLATGKQSRDSHLNIGMAFKGSGSIDPSGIPILYLGSGDDLPNKTGRAYIYSLIDFEKLLEFGVKPDPFSERKFHAYDSSALIDSKTGTMIYPGENGILYTMKINPRIEEGKVKINPTVQVKWKYLSSRMKQDVKWEYYYGMEDSAVGWKNYIYIADNAGQIQCIDINTMKTVWVQDTADDTNGSPVMELSEDGTKAYLYIAPSLRVTAKGSGEDRTGTI